MQLFSYLLVTVNLAVAATAQPVNQNSPLTGDPIFLEPTSENVARAATPPLKAAYQKAVLASHNAHRSNHSALALQWDGEMAQAARTLAHRCVWQHNTSIGDAAYGQNLAAGWQKIDIGAAITNGWYGEMPNYKSQYGKDTPDMSKFGSYGHFTQLVWKGSKTVGCVTYDCSKSSKGGLVDPNTGKVMPGLNWFTVCNYSPPGNYLGEFAKNVGKPLGKPAYVPKPI